MKKTHLSDHDYSTEMLTHMMPFYSYYVDVTPVKKLIFRIMARVTIKEGCLASYQTFKKVLGRKYGPTESSTDVWRRKKDGKN